MQSKLIPGKTYLRDKCVEYPSGVKDYSFTKTPMIFEKEVGDGHLKMRYSPRSFYGACLGDDDALTELPEEFNDGHWLLYEEAMNQEKTTLNDWAGQKVRRIAPVSDGEYVDNSFTRESAQLVCATKCHVFLKVNDMTFILDERFTNPSDWVKA